MSEDAGIEPRTVATQAFAVRRSYHSARFHPQLARSHPQLSSVLYNETSYMCRIKLHVKEITEIRANILGKALLRIPIAFTLKKTAKRSKKIEN